jgi:hypothetical protein
VALFCGALLDSRERQNEIVSVVFIGAEEMRGLNTMVVSVSPITAEPQKRLLKPPIKPTSKAFG